MSSTPAPGQADGIRPLPSRPSLELERKQARKLLRRLHDGDPEALDRLRAQKASAGRAPHSLKLADAQFTIAREYGFRSWPRLVQYFTIVERHERSGPLQSGYPPEHYDELAQGIVRLHEKRLPWGAEMLASFVPRFYGMRPEDVAASSITLDDARLVVARQERYPSWEALITAAARPMRDAWERQLSPLGKARRAIRDEDLGALQAIVEAFPELLQGGGADARFEERRGHPLMRACLWREIETRSAGAKVLTDWVISRGVDPTETLNHMLIDRFRGRSVEKVEFLLARGADPAWMPPNGISVLEHAIIGYWNGRAVDLIARRVVPPKAFWIAAGVGDVRGVERYFRRDGTLTPAARAHRPDFTAVGPGAWPMLPEADDMEIMWEAFFLAGLNERFDVLDVLLDRGFPIDYVYGGSTLLHFAVGNAFEALVEFLVRRGASLDLEGFMPTANARELAESHFQMAPSRPGMRRILELCGGRDPETLLRESAERRGKPRIMTGLQRHLDLAAEEAARLGQPEVRPDNLLLGILRENPDYVLVLISKAGGDLDRLRRSLEHRLVPANPEGPTHEVPHGPEVRKVLGDATEEAERRGNSSVTSIHLLDALAMDESGPVADILRSAGTTLRRLRDELQSIL